MTNQPPESNLELANTDLPPIKFLTVTNASAPIWLVTVSSWRGEGMKLGYDSQTMYHQVKTYDYLYSRYKDRGKSGLDLSSGESVGNRDCNDQGKLRESTSKSFNLSIRKGR